MLMISEYDLHTHSTASDGSLTPSELVRQARQFGVRHLALTDHDSTAGLAEAEAAATSGGITLIAGIELSVTWCRHCIHILGLNIDPSNRRLQQGITAIQSLRVSRAREMGARLKKKGIEGAFQGALQLAGEGMLTRTHFARFLVNQGHVDTIQGAFDRFLGVDKPAYVAVRWAELEQALDWINDAGGTAVIAHPMRYRLSGAGLRRLLDAFKQCGGRGLEVVCGNSSDDLIRCAAEQARRFGLLGSVGSDFHGPEQTWIQLGRLAALPAGIQPVWSVWPQSGH
jgi:predicted metal-dependent phosphoesterase TrpH